MKVKINVPGVSLIRPDMQSATTARMYVNNYVTTLLSRGISNQLCMFIMYAMDINVVRDILIVNDEDKPRYIQVLLETIMLELKLSENEITDTEELIIKTTLQQLF